MTLSDSNNTRLKRWLWPAVAGLLLVGGLGYAFRPVPVPVEIATLARGALSVTVEDDGITRVKDVFLMSAPISGVVERIATEAGDPVTAGETVVARLLPGTAGLLDQRTARQRREAVDSAKAAEAQAKADIAYQEASLQQAQSDFERVQKLNGPGFTSAAELERARTNVLTITSALDRARAALRQRQFDVKSAEAAMIESADPHGKGVTVVTLKAPVSGRVLRRLVESEQVVTAGMPLVELGDASNLEVVIDFLSRDAVRVTPGDAAEIKRWGGEGVLNGKVRTVEPFGILKVSSLGIEEQRVNVVIDFTDPPAKWQRLGHGYQVDAAVILWHGDKVLKLPLSALFRKGEDWMTFRIVDGRAQQTRVGIGHINTEYAEVLDGLKEGDRVVTNPGTHVVDGVHVVAEGG